MFSDQFLSDADRAAIKLAQEFAAKHISEENVVRWCQDGGVPDAVMIDYRDSGLGYMGIPESILIKHGIVDHLGVSILGQMKIVKELSRIAGATLPFQSQVYSLNIFSRLANEDQMDMLFDGLSRSGRSYFSSAISDVHSGSDLFGSTTAVTKRNNKLYLNGQKAFVGHGQHAPYILVFAKNMIDNDGDNKIKAPLSAWLVPLHSKGVTTFPIEKIGQQMVDSAAIVFDDVEIDPKWQVSITDNSRTILEPVINLGRCVVCASSLGMAEAAFEDASRWAQSHQIRDKHIGDFQQIALMLTDMACKIVNMEAHVYRCATLLDKNPLATFETALMKKYVPSSAVEVADSAIQIFGGVGYTSATRVARIWLDCRGNQFVTGTDQIMVNLATREILKHYSQNDAKSIFDM